MISKKISKRSITTLVLILLSTMAPAAAMKNSEATVWKPKNDKQINILNESFLRAVIKGDVKKVCDRINIKNEYGNGTVIDVNFKGDQKFTPLLIACMNGYTEIVQILLAQDINSIGNGSYDDDGCNNTLMWAIRNDHTETAKVLINHHIGWQSWRDVYFNQDYLYYTNKNRYTALHWAAKMGNKEILLLLLKNELHVNSRAYNSWNQTPLHEAAYAGKTEVADILIAHGALLTAETDFDKKTPLMYAIDGGHLNTIKLLIKHSDAVTIKNAFDKAKNTTDKKLILHYTNNLGRLEELEKLEYLKKLEPDFFKAIKKNDLKQMLTYLNKGVHTEAIDSEKNTPLIVASYCGHLAAVKLLIHYGASTASVKTALDKADENKQTSVVQYLQEYTKNLKTIQEMIKEKIRNVYSNETDKEGNTPLILACSYGMTYVVKELLSLKINKKIFRLEAKNNAGKTALMTASIESFPKIIELLIQHGAKLETADKKGNTALMLTYFNEKFEALDVLLKNGAKINAANKDGQTILMFASKHGHMNNVKLFVQQHGVNIDARDNNNHNAFDYASFNNKILVAGYLRNVQNEFTVFKTNPLQITTTEQKSSYIKMLHKNDVYYIDLITLFKNYSKNVEFKDALKECLLSKYSKEEREKLRKNNVVALLPHELAMKLILANHRTKNNFTDLIFEYTTNQNKIKNPKIKKTNKYKIGKA